MKKILVLIFISLLSLIFFSVKVEAKKTDSCVTIQDGTLLRSDGAVIKTGNDEWGYNYQAHLFNGGYCDSYRNAPWCQLWKDVRLVMKWNDPWLSNKDCDGDGLLDRHFGYPTYKESGAWTTNHQFGTYDQDGKTETWNYFVKIVAVPKGAALTGGVWYLNGKELGPSIWGEFAVVEEVYNDTGTGEHGILYKSPIGPGLGKY